MLELSTWRYAAFGDGSVASSWVTGSWVASACSEMAGVCFEMVPDFLMGLVRLC